MFFENILARKIVRKKAKIPEIKTAVKIINKLLNEKVSSNFEIATALPVLDF